jgi:hypothetical protein
METVAEAGEPMDVDGDGAPEVPETQARAKHAMNGAPRPREVPLRGSGSRDGEGGLHPGRPNGDTEGSPERKRAHSTLESQHRAAEAQYRAAAERNEFYIKKIAEMEALIAGLNRKCEQLSNRRDLEEEEDPDRLA